MYHRSKVGWTKHIDFMILLKCNQEEIIKNRKAISRAASRIGLRNDIMVSLLARNYSEYENNIAYQPFYQNIEREGRDIYR